MKKTVRHIILLTTATMLSGVNMGCQQRMGWRTEEVDVDTLTTTGFSIDPALLLDSIRQQMAQDRKNELDYYLDRHNVEDEGYEMVAAFAAGKRHSETIDTIPIYNVGRWKGKKRQRFRNPAV